MPIATAASRIFSTIIELLHTRLDLIRVELEEELLRFSTYFVYALIALFCGGVAVSFVLVLILTLFWDEHRVAIMTGYIVVFSAISIFIFSWLKNQIANKPHLLEQSIAEFKKDLELVRPHEPELEEQPKERDGLEL